MPLRIRNVMNRKFIQCVMRIQAGKSRGGTQSPFGGRRLVMPVPPVGGGDVHPRDYREVEADEQQLRSHREGAGGLVPPPYGFREARKAPRAAYDVPHDRHAAEEGSQEPAPS